MSHKISYHVHEATISDCIEHSAKDAVFLTPELLEAILLNLHMKDVLVSSMRVNRAWNTTIKDSPLIQQHLFFTDVPSPRNPVWTKNPLLAEKFPVWFSDLRATERYFPQLSDQELGDYPGPYKLHRFARLQTTMKKSDWAANPDAYSRREASWRRMLVIQPAPRRFNVAHAVLFRKKWVWTREQRRVPECGLQMDFLYDFVVGRADDWGVSFAFQWNMFVVEEDLETSEYVGEGDSISHDALIQRNEDEDTVTLICKDIRDGRMPKRFKSKAEDASVNEFLLRIA